MIKPIKLYIPDYYDTFSIEDDRVLMRKAKSLLNEDNNASKFIASLESPENYLCHIPEIGEKYSKIATNCFHRDRKENWELPMQVSDCKVYTYNWDDEDFHFRIYWIIISEEYMLQLVGIFEPKYSAFYKKHFTNCLHSTEINTHFNYAENFEIEELFDVKKVEVSLQELQDLIDFEKQKKEKQQFSEENLKVSNPNFYIVLETELKEKNEVLIDAFMCRDWKLYYNLFNPENFSDPDSTIEWEDNSDVFEYYEKPFTNDEKVTILSENKEFNATALKHLISNKDIAEQKLLTFFEQYTFGNGGAYADAIHYQYAKIEIERLHGTTFSNQEFLKRNLCLTDIIITENPNELKLHFKCSWDYEHGIEIILDENLECKAEL